MGALSGLVAAFVAAFGAASLLLAAQLVLLVPLSLVYGFWKRRALGRLERCDPYRGRVTVLVPAYNEERTLRACVDSILASDYPDVEVIVVDDGSSDGTAAAVADLAELGRIRLLRQANGGKARALNRGIESASGEVVLFTDADSLFLPGTVRQMARWFGDPKLHAVCGNDQPLHVGAPLQKALAVTTHIGTGFVRRALCVLRVLPIITGNLGAVRTATLREIGGFRPVWGEDLELTFRLQKAGRRIVFDPEPVVLADCPAGLAALWRQRVRWARSYIKVVGMHPDLLWPPRALPFSAYLPVNAFAQVVIPLLQLAALPLLLRMGATGGDAFARVANLVLYMGLLSFLAISVYSIALDRDWRTLRHVPLTALLIVPLSYFYNLVVLASVWKELRGEAEHWGKLERVPTGALARWGGASLAVAGVVMIGGSVLLGFAGRTTLAHRAAEPEWRAPYPRAGTLALGTHFEAWPEWARATTSILDNPSARGVSVVGIGAGRLEWTYFRWPGHRDRWSGTQRAEASDLLGESVKAFGQRGVRAAAILDVYSPAFVKAEPEKAAVRFDGERSAEQVEFMELVEGGYGQELVALAAYLAHAYDLEAVALTELGYRSYCYDDRCLASYRTATGRADWPRRPSGVVDVDDPSVWDWRTARMEGFLRRAALVLHGAGKKLYVDVPVSWDDLRRHGRDAGLDYARVLRHADRIVVWNYFAMDGRPPEVSRELARELRRAVPRDRVFVSIGLWGPRGGVVSPEEFGRAIRYTLEGGVSNLWITPNHLMTPAHWDALTGVLGHPGT